MELPLVVHVIMWLLVVILVLFTIVTIALVISEW